MKPLCNPVVVIGIEHHNTLGVIRSLGKVGLKKVLYVIINAERKNFIKKSRYVINSHIIYVTDDSEISDKLLEMSANFSKKATIICCSDNFMAQIDMHRNLLEEAYYLPGIIGMPGKLCELQDKEKQIEIAKNCGIDIPNTKLIHKNDKIAWNDYPCILKPGNSTKGLKKDITICERYDELCKSIENSNCDDFILQKYIDKDFEFQLIGLSLDKGQKLIVPGYSRIIRQPCNTNSGFLSWNPYPNHTMDMSKVNAYFEKCQYEGLFSMEFIKGKDGKNYFLEVNFRNDGNSYVVTDSGNNLPLFYYNYKVSGNINNIKNEFKKHYFICDFFDIADLFYRRLKVSQWLHDFLIADTHSLFSWCDPLPFIIVFVNIIRGKIKRVLIK